MVQSDSCWNCGIALSSTRDLPIVDCTSTAPLGNLLSSNNPPLDVEALTVRRALVHHQARMDVLNARIDILQAALEGLARERDALENDMNRLRGAVSPLRRMPPEVLCEVFLQVQQPRSARKTQPEPPPWYLGGVCSSWRTTALGFSILWTSLSICWAAQPTEDERDRLLSKLESQLLRSAEAPLDIELRERPHFHHDTPSSLPLLDALLRHCNRWSTIRLNGYTNIHNLFNYLLLVKAQFFQLRELVLKNIFDDLEGDYPGSEIFMRAPALRKVVLIRSVAPSISWEQVTSLHAHHVFTDSLRHLVNSVDLVHLHITNSPHDTLEDSLTLPHLHTLLLDPGAPLDLITAPNLAFLSTVGDIEPVIDFIERSSCQLTSLILKKCASPDLHSLLRITPALETLVLSPPTDPDGDSDDEAPDSMCGGWLRGLTLAELPDALCTRLTSFIYASVLDPEDPDVYDSFAAMARSRFDPSLPHLLTFVRAQASVQGPAWTIHADDATQELREDGMDIAFVDENVVEKLVSDLEGRVY